MDKRVSNKTTQCCTKQTKVSAEIYNAYCNNNIVISNNCRKYKHCTRHDTGLSEAILPAN